MTGPLVGCLVLVVGVGLGALYFAQPGRARQPLLGILTACFAALLVAAFALAASGDTSTAAPPTPSVTPTPSAASLAQVLQLVAASNHIEHVPADLVPHSYAEAVSRPNLGFPPSQCVQGAGDDSVPACVFGDTSASRTVVLYGDSHAGMWFHAFDDIAQRDGWKLVVLFKEGCPASLISVRLPLVAQDFTQCDAWHRNVLQRINALDPDVLVVTQEIDSAPDGTYFSPSQWQGAMQDLLTTAKAGRKVVLGDIPITPGPLCVSRFPKTVQQCSRPPGNGLHGYNGAERAAAQAAHATYVDVTPWFCARRCSSVIGNFNVYWNPYHVAVGYTEFLEGVLAHALGL